MKDLRELPNIFKNCKFHIRDCEDLNYAIIEYKDGTRVDVFSGNDIICLDYGETYTKSNIVNTIEALSMYNNKCIALIIIDRR